jgi:hypothetical protein
MTDLFLLLVPLAILPIVLLFAFVGCGFATAGIPGLSQLHYPAGLKANLAQMVVTLKVTGTNGQVQSATKTVTKAGILSEGGFISFGDVIDQDDDDFWAGSATCDCAILLDGNIGVPIMTAPHADVTTFFELTGTGPDPNSFSLV